MSPSTSASASRRMRMEKTSQPLSSEWAEHGSKGVRGRAEASGGEGLEARPREALGDQRLLLNRKGDGDVTRREAVGRSCRHEPGGNDNARGVGHGRDTCDLDETQYAGTHLRDQIKLTLLRATVARRRKALSHRAFSAMARHRRARADARRGARATV
jgi:hypothetical protein